MTHDGDAAPPRDVAVVVVAAGSGQRLGAGVPKALVEVGGRTLVGHVLHTLDGWPALAQVVVVAPPSDLVRMREIAASLRHTRQCTVVPGGADRRASVEAGVRSLGDGPPPIVLVHDAARALTPRALFDSVASHVRQGHRAVVPGVPVADTIKQVTPDGVVVGTPPRSSLRAIQTPQGFATDLLRQAHATVPLGPTMTDDASLVEALGGAVLVVDGDDRARKVTTPEDLVWVAQMTGAS